MSTRNSGKKNREQNRGKRARSRSNKNNIVVNRGSAFKDALNGLPLLGKRFEYGHLLYYDYQHSLTGATGTFTTRYFRANDLYDPDATGVGSQPIGFDQAMLFWEQFSVFGAKISVTFTSASDTAVRCGIFLNPDTVNPTPIVCMENGLVNSRVIAGLQTGNARSMATINLDVDNVKYFQMKSKEEYFASDKFQGTAASTPTEMVYFGVFAFGMATATNFTVHLDVLISYDARFQEPRKIANSVPEEKQPVPELLQPPMGARRDILPRKKGIRGYKPASSLGVRFNSPFGKVPREIDEDGEERKDPSDTVSLEPLSLHSRDPFIGLIDDTEMETVSLSNEPTQSTCVV